MTTGLGDEFRTVDRILAFDDSPTKNVDAFCLTWIKFERQMRKLTFNILFQATIFDRSNKEELRQIIWANDRKWRYTVFQSKIYQLTDQSVKEIIGERYKKLTNSIQNAEKHRDKIFHGLETGRKLTDRQIRGALDDVREWCEILAREGNARFDYDGLARDSLRKTSNKDIVSAVDKAMAGKSWRQFVQEF